MSRYLLVLFAFGVLSWGFEYYNIVDQDLYLDHKVIELKHHHMIGFFPSCEEVRPVIKLSLHSFDVNHSSTILDHEKLQHSKLVQLLKDSNDALSSNASTPLITTSIGWLEFTIYDIMIDRKDVSKSLLCYDGQVHKYASQRCGDEDPNHPTLYRSEFLGGNGYDFHLYSEGKARYWSPVRDNRDGTYSVRIRVDDPAVYKIELLVNNRKGCHFADCDVPKSICDTFKPYGPRMEFCKIDDNCVKVVHSMLINITDHDQWPPYKVTKDDRVSYSLPDCTVYQMGSMNGRWLSPPYMKARYRYLPPFHSPLAPHPYVWQPFDCKLHWMTQEEVESCIGDKEFVFTGLSRERTNFFDLLDFQHKPIQYIKYMETDTIENINYFSVYRPEITDRKHWNRNGHLARTISWIGDDLKAHGLCVSHTEYVNLVSKLQGDLHGAKDANMANRVNYTIQSIEARQHRKVAFLFTEENLWTAEVGLQSIWSGLSRSFIKHFGEQCSNATVVYKGSSSLRAQFGSLSWQRMYEASRVSMKNARALHLPVLDSFIMTHPWIMSKDVYPDGLHLFSSTKFQGNWVSKTTSMIFLQQVCAQQSQVSIV